MRERVKKQRDEPKSPDEGACLRFSVNRNRQREGVFKIFNLTESAE